MRRPIKYQILRLVIPAAGSYPLTAETDKSYKRITGVHFNSSDANALKDSVFTTFEIDSNEIFPDGFEAHMITTGKELSPNDVYYDLNERAEGSTVKVIYKDAGNAVAYPYNAYLYLKLETADTQSIGHEL